MAFLNQVREELEEEGNHQQADVHAIDIGIGRHNDLVVSKPFHAVLDVEGRLQKVEFFVLIDHLLGETIRVERLTTEAEYGLRVHVAALGDGTAGRVALGDEDTGFFLLVALGVIQVETAVTELAVVEVRFLGTFTGQLGDTGNGLAFLFRFLNLLQHHIGHLRILMQVVIDLGLDEIAHKLVDTRSGRLVFLRHGRPHVVRTQLGLGLALEHRFFHIEGYGRHDTVTDVGELLVLVVELLDGAGDVFLQGTLVRTALGGVLTVHKGIVFLAILVGMSEGNLNVLAFQMHNIIKPFGGHVVLQ